MFTTSLKRSGAALAVTAGLLVAAAGPASASATGCGITRPIDSRIPVDDMDLSIRADAVNLSITAQDGDSRAGALVDFAPGVCYAK